jgi:signal transduction histidine kinase
MQQHPDWIATHLFMPRKLFKPGPFKTFYVVFAYIMIFAVWWAYLLYQKNEAAYKENVELNQINFRQTNPHEDYANTQDYLKMHTLYLRQKVMILSEGAVFIALLVLGFLRVRKVFLHEMELSGQQRNFLLSITHELKSPVSTIKLSLQTLAMRKLEAEQTEMLITNSLVDVDRLESLVDNILLSAKIEKNTAGFANDEINISEIIQYSVERFVHNKKGIGIECAVKPAVYLQADALGFASVVNNLIENSIKYSESGTQIKLSLEENDGDVLFTIADQGQGIPNEERERVFEKFYRIGNENTRKTKGTGLGLYIVKRFVEIYKGEIWIEDNSPSGSKFVLAFRGLPGAPEIASDEAP